MESRLQTCHETCIPVELRRFLRLALVLTFLALGSAAFAVSDGVTGAVVVVTTGPDVDPLDTLRRVVRSSMELQLRQDGFVVLDGGSWTASEDPVRAPGTGRLDTDADFALAAVLEIRNTDLVIELVMSRLNDGRVIARTRATEPVGLMLDRTVARLTARIVELSRPQIAAAAAARRERASDPAPAAAQHAADPAAAQHAADRAAAQHAGDRAAEDPRGDPDAALPLEPAVMTPNAPDAPIKPSGAAPVSPATPPVRRFVLSAQFAPFVPVDEAARYLGPDLGAGFSAVVRPFPAELVGFGMSVYTLAGTATGVAATADLQVVSMAVSALLSGSGMPAVPYLKVAGGIALIVAHNDALGTVRGVAPYAAADLGVMLDLIGPLGIDITVGFKAYRTGTSVIVGAVPGVGMVLRL